MCCRCREASVQQEHLIEFCSGAGHDSCSTSMRIPAAMISVFSKDGVSHNFHEYSSPKEIESGFKVHLEYVINYDNLRHDRGH